MANKSSLNTRVSSLVKYVLDIKPFHSKLIGFTSEVNLSDSLALTFVDNQPQHTIYHQNVWGAADIPTMVTVSDGSEASRLIVVPYTVMARFSSTDDVKQQPLGDDQALFNLTDSNTDGVPDSAYPWTRTPTQSHQLGSDMVPVRLNIEALTVTVTALSGAAYTATVAGTFNLIAPTIFGIPLTQLSLTVNGYPYTVNGTSGSFTTAATGSYNPAFMTADATLPSLTTTQLAEAYLLSKVELWAVVDTGRYAVPFHNGSRVRRNNAPLTFGVDDDYIVDETRTFLQFMANKHPVGTDKLDINLLNSDRLFISICDPFAKDGGSSGSDHFIIRVDDSLLGRKQVSFVNTQPGTNKAFLDAMMIYPSQADGNIWRVTGTDLFSVTVQQLHPIIGPIERALINEPFDNGKLAFTLKAPWVEYYLTANANSYVAYGMLPYDDGHYAGPPDEADYWPNVNVTDNYDSVKFNELGELKTRFVNGLPQQVFELATTPSRGSYIELRVEQAKQLNPRAQLSMHEHLSIVQIVGASSASTVKDYHVYSTHEFGTT